MIAEGWSSDVERKKLVDFEERRSKNRTQAEQDLATADYGLLEFDRYVQTPNDAYATEIRLKVMLARIIERDLPATAAVEGGRWAS